MRGLCGFLFCVVPVFAQTPRATPANRMSGEQVVEIFNHISQHAARLEPMLQQLHPPDWVTKGASDTYVSQFQSALQQVAAIQTEMSDLAQHPERMSGCMKALFRVGAMHRITESLMGGLRKYQNPALADLIESVAAEDRRDLDRLEQYVLELADDKEQQFDVVSQEAQRCRAELSRQPPRLR